GSVLDCIEDALTPCCPRRSRCRCSWCCLWRWNHGVDVSGVVTRGEDRFVREEGEGHQATRAGFVGDCWCRLLCASQSFLREAAKVVEFSVRSGVRAGGL
ncbi:unnamed protein product, partial [Ectocarpus sp. 12 AP-2014]